VACAAAALILCAPAWGTLVSYTVDPAQSSLAMTGSWNGLALWERPVDSLTTSYQGQIQAELANDSIELISATLDAQSGGTFRPRSGGRGGRQQADYAGFHRAGLFGLRGNVNVAFRDVALDLAGAPLGLTGGQFDASQLTVTAASGNMDYAGAGLMRPLVGHGRAPMQGGDVANAVSTAGTVVLNGSVETITIPVNSTFRVKIDSWLPSRYEWFDVTLAGSIVATRTVTAEDSGHVIPPDTDPGPQVPEPATVSLLLMGLGFGLLRFRRS
jgi:hypothetical protein